MLHGQQVRVELERMAVEWRGRLTSRAENAHAQLGRLVVEQGASHRERRAQQRVARAAALQNIERLKRQQQDGEAEAAAAVGREAANLQARLMQRLAGAQAALEARHALTAVFGAPKQARDRAHARYTPYSVPRHAPYMPCHAPHQPG